MWVLDIHDDVGKRAKKFTKKWPHELKNVFDNLDTLQSAVTDGTKHEQLKKLPFVRSEPKRVLAIDQSGPGKGTKMKHFRLYLVMDEIQKILYVRVLGEKKTQTADLKIVTAFAEAINEKNSEGARDGNETQDFERGELSDNEISDRE